MKGLDANVLLRYIVEDDEAQTRQEVEVGPHRGAHEGEEYADGLAVERMEVYGILEEAERDGRLRYVEDDGIPHVRDGNAVTDARGAERLSREKHLVEEAPVHFFRQLEDIDDRAEH